MADKFKVLILDDDEFFAGSLSESLQAYNYETTVCLSTFDAEDKLKAFSPDLLIVDLFMPNGNGSDWISSLLEQPDFKVPVVYVSGVFTDVEFQNNLLNHSLILKVFSKPFEISSLLQMLEEHQGNEKLASAASIQVSDLSYTEQALISGNYKDVYFLNNFKKPITFEANNLPQYLNYFFQTEATGVVKIKKNTVETEIYYNKGNISFIQTDDESTSFGLLLAKLTPLNYTEIEKYCTQAKEAKQSIGSFLLEHSLIEEIEIFKVVNLQIALRLLKLFDDQQVSCEWNEEGALAKEKIGYFSILEWQRILIRFSNNLKEDWVSLFSKKFSSYYFILKKENLPQSTQNIELLEIFSQFKTDLSSSYIQVKNLQLIDNSKKLRAIYLFLLLNVLALSDSKQLSKKDLLAIKKKNKGKNYFEILNINLDSTEINIKQSYRSLSKKFHPDNCAFSASLEEKELYEEIFNSISQAYTTLSKSQARKSYQSLLEQEQFEEQFKGQLLESEIISQLKNQDLSNLLGKINNSTVVYGKKQVFLFWALIVAYRVESSSTKKQAIKTKMKTYLKNIPNSILQFNHYIYLTKAMYYEIVENFEEAKYYFSKVQNIDSLDVVNNLKDIETVLLKKRKHHIRKRDMKFGMLISMVVVVVLGYKVAVKDTNISRSRIKNNIQANSAIEIEKKITKRSLSFVDKKIQVESYFSNLTGFHVDTIKDSKNSRIVSLKNYLLISKEGNKNKLTILIYKQLKTANFTITGKNFLRKQKILTEVNKLLKRKPILSKQTSAIWYGKLSDERKTSLVVKYIKEHRSFVYFIGDFKNIAQFDENILEGLSQL